MKAYLLPIILLSLVFSSCTIEDDFKELSRHNDFLIETQIVFKEPDESFDLEFIYYKTDGYNNLLKTYFYAGGAGNEETFSYVVKEYRKVGIGMANTDNIEHITITFYEVRPFMTPYFQYQHEASGPFTLLYDFATGTHEVIQE